VLLARAARGGDPQARLIVDPAVRADPHPLHDEVRARGPLVRGRLSHVTATHAVCREVLRSEDFGVIGVEEAGPALFRALLAWSHDSRALGPIDPPSLLAVEPPDHTRYRRLVSKVFTARAVEALRPDVQAVADRLLDGLLAEPGHDRFDLVERYATLLPVTVIAQILGVPEREHARVLELGNAVAPSLDLGLTLREYRAVQRGLVAFNAWLEEHLAALRRQPGDDLLSQLVTVEDEGERLDDVELRSTAGLLLGAGFETTVNLIGNGARLLVEHPDQLARLQADPGRWPGAVEEVLRYESPVQVTGRAVLRPTEVAGRPLRPGAFVVTLLAGANRDPDVFADPHAFDVTRPNAREHLAFSGGRHFCLGAALARVEGEVGLRTLFDRLPDLALAPGARRRETRVLRGWERLPVTTGV
jgi:cytochrome P450